MKLAASQSFVYSLVGLTSLLSLVQAAPSPSTPHKTLSYLLRREANVEDLPGGEPVPQACETECKTTVDLYDQCEQNNDACFNVCTDPNINGLYECVNCAFIHESFTSVEYTSMQTILGALEASCDNHAAASPNVTVALTPYATLTAAWAASSVPAAVPTESSTSAGAHTAVALKGVVSAVGVVVALALVLV